MAPFTQKMVKDMADVSDSAGERENILLVDDRPANLMVYTSILEELGQTLVTATSGEEALKKVLKQDFAVILLDVNMPTMNGFDTAALIRQRRRSSTTPIIFLTAFTDEVNINQGYASGAVDFMPTPVNPEVLKAKVRVFIELSQMRRQAASQAEERVRREAAEETARNFAFLAEISETLARAQTRSDFMRSLVQLPVPHHADAALVWFKTDGQPDQIEWADGDGSMTASPAALDRIEPAVDQVLADGKPRVVTDLIGGALAYAQILPLTVQGRVEGVLALGSRQPRVAVTPLAAELASRASVALENVTLMDRIREADRRKDEFLGMLAHELRNPLGPIYNCLQLQKMLKPDDPRFGIMRDMVDRQIKHMGRLIDDLLDATRLAHGKILLRKEACDLGALVRQTVEDYRPVIEGAGMTITLALPDNPLPVDGDPTRLVQIVGNLLHNAHKFNNPGGAITVSAETANGAARVMVRDSGIGIEPAMLSQVFDVFRQAEQGLDRSRGGLGLGLALVKGLVRLHGGSVTVRSDGVNTGAEFTVVFPLTAARTDTAGARDGRDGAQPAHRILVIEDNRDAAESAHMLLRHEGHEVEVAFDALSGLDRAGTFAPDVILCDIGLPVMDGYQVIRRIRETAHLSSVFAIALTGYGRESDQKQALDAGFDLHLTKPIDFTELRSALGKAHRTREDAAAVT